MNEKKKKEKMLFSHFSHNIFLSSVIHPKNPPNFEWVLIFLMQPFKKKTMYAEPATI